MANDPQTTKFYRNGWIKMALSFVIMGLALTFKEPWMVGVQFIAGIAYFCLGLKLVLDARKS